MNCRKTFLNWSRSLLEKILNYWLFMIFLTSSRVMSSTLEGTVSNIESLRNEATLCHLLRNYWFCVEGFTEANTACFNFQNSGAYPELCICALYDPESLWNHTTTDHKEGEQLEDRRNVGASSCNSGDGTDQSIKSLMFMMMIMISQ